MVERDFFFIVKIADLFYSSSEDCRRKNYNSFDRLQVIAGKSSTINEDNIGYGVSFCAGSMTVVDVDFLLDR